MTSLDPHAERLWQQFRDEMRELAETRRIDADDLLSSLDEHLRQLAGDRTLDAREIRPIVDSLRDELSGELAPDDAPGTPAGGTWKPTVASLGGFVVALLSFPFLGPLLILPSWALSAFLGRRVAPRNALVLFPARVYAVGLVAGAVFAASYLPVLLAAEVGWLTWPWTAVVFAGLIAAFAGGAMLALHRPIALVDRLLFPVPEGVRRHVRRSVAGWTAVAGMIAVVAGLVGAWYGA